MNSAKYDLQKVFPLVNNRDVEFNSPSRSIFEVIKFFDQKQKPCSNVEAMEYIFEGILSLNENCFSRRILQWDIVADEYGLQFEGENWYVKFLIDKDDDGEFLEEISFHPLEKEMTLANGKKLKGGKK